MIVVRRVVMPVSETVSWTVVGDDGAVIEPVEQYLAYLTALERSPNTVVAYATSLRLFFEFLRRAELAWAEVGAEDVARFVSWLRAPADNVIVLDATAGRRSPATVNRHLAAVFGFYDHHARAGVGAAAELVAWRRVGRGSYKPMLHHVTKGRPIATRPIKLPVARRPPRALSAEQVVAIVAAAERARDRFLLALLAETGMRIGQALGLRHSDVMSRDKQIRIVTRADNANGARAKLASTAQIPVSAGLVRLYSDYLHSEYRDLDSDYVFVNLWGGRIGAPLTYATVHKLFGRIQARSGVEFTAHILRHTHATELVRAGVAIDVVAKLLTHRSSTTTQPNLCAPRCSRRPRSVTPSRGVRRQGAATVSAASGANLSRRFSVLDGGGTIDAEYAKDEWDAHVLGVAARRGHSTARFGAIHQPWLRDAVKRWSRFRLGSGYAFLTVATGAKSLARFSSFLDDRHRSLPDHTALTRAVLEDYLTWIASRPIATNTRSLDLSFVKVFLDWARRHRSLPGLPDGAVIYDEEVARPDDALPRFIPEFVMAQLESETNLARIRNPSVRHLVVVLIETGLRGGDACELPFNPMFDDSVGAPCLRFHNSKVRAEQLIPLSIKAAAVIRAQQAHVLDRWPNGSPWLFPGILDNPDGAKPYAHMSLSGQLGRWQTAIDLRDEAGQPVRIHAHQFRHTVGTRLINKGVPQHVVQKLLGHASPRMTARYAQIHDHTVRDAFDAYCAQRVNIAGQHLPYDPDALTADAEWAKHNLSRIRDSLPNGYCGRPPQQECPHPNACLTCPDFHTTPEFIEIHRKQADTNRTLIARADADGRFRLADNLRQVQASLERIIPALENLTNEPNP